MEKNEFVVLTAQVEVRSGSRAPWIEVKVTKKDGSVLKYLMKKVPAFYSEREENMGELS